MQLRKSEALCNEDDHHRGVGHIDTYLDDGGGHENLCLAAYELLHLLLFVLGLHFAVHLTQAEFRESLTQHFEALLQVLQVDLFTLLDEREDDIHLSPLIDLLTDAVVERRHAGVEDVRGADGLATWRQLVDDTHVEIAIERHGQRARNRRCCHHQYMRRVGALTP